MEFGKRHDTTDTTDFCPHQLVTDLLLTRRDHSSLGKLKMRGSGATVAKGVTYITSPLHEIKYYIHLYSSEQEAQLPQRNSASAVHVYLGWITDRAMQRTPQNRRGCNISDIQTL